MKEIKIKDEYITLSSLLKLADIASSGAEAKIFVKDGIVKYNNEVCLMRNKKVYVGDTITFDNHITIKVIN